MSFDPKTVLLNIRNRKNLHKAPAQDSVLSQNEPSSCDRDRARDEHSSQSVIHVMSEQIRYMQDHIRRLESQLAEAHIEISRLKSARGAAPLAEVRREPSVGSVSIHRSKKSDASVSGMGRPGLSPLARKASVSQANLASNSFEQLPRPAGSHHKSSSALVPQPHPQPSQGYLGVYVSGRSREGSEHGSSQAPQYGSKQRSVQSKADLRIPGIKEASDLRLDILEKILSLEENSSVPHLAITFV